MYKPRLQYLLFSSLSYTYSTNLNLKNTETNQKHVFYSKCCKASSWTLKAGKNVMIEILKKIWPV